MILINVIIASILIYSIVSHQGFGYSAIFLALLLCGQIFLLLIIGVSYSSRFYSKLLYHVIFFMLL